MATRRTSRVLLAVLVLWAAFGSWALFRPDAGDVSGLDPAVGHVVVFFFVSLAAFGLTTRRFGTAVGLVAGVALVGVGAAVSEWLQPILTETRLAQTSDLIANGFGIGAAVIGSLLLIGLLRDDRRRAAVTVAFCLFGLVVSAAITVVGVDGPLVAWQCRGQGYERLSDPIGDPIIAFDGSTVMVGPTRSGDAARQQPLGDGIVADDSADLRCSVLRGGGYTIVATVLPESIESNGPTRIFTSSVGTAFPEENTHIGQDFDELSVRVRTDDGFQWESVPGVFRAGEPVTVAVAVADGEATVFVDGQERESFELRGTSFLEWNEEFPLLIGDEFTRDRTFEGEILSVAVFDRALAQDHPAVRPPS